MGGKGTLLRKLRPSPARWSPSWGTQMGWKQPCRGPINMSLQVTGVPLGFPAGCGVVEGHQNQLTAEGPGLGRLGQGGARKGRMERAEPRVLSPLRNRDPPYSPGSGQADALGRGQWKYPGSRKEDYSQRRQALANKRQREHKCFWSQPMRRQPEPRAHLACRRWSLGRIRGFWHLRPRLARALHNSVDGKEVAS